MTDTLTKTPTPTGFPPSTFNRVLDEGYGPGAWYGADLRTATEGLPAAVAFARPAAGRHNVAEIALHHAYWATQLAAKLTGTAPSKFPLEGEDWFDLDDESRLSWSTVRGTLDAAQARLSEAVQSPTSPLSEAERFDIAIGITGHAAYHAGQIQLVKVLVSGQ